MRNERSSQRRQHLEHRKTLIPFRNHSNEFLLGSSSLKADGFIQTHPTPHSSHICSETIKTYQHAVAKENPVYQRGGTTPTGSDQSNPASRQPLARFSLTNGSPIAVWVENATAQPEAQSMPSVCISVDSVSSKARLIDLLLLLNSAVAQRALPLKATIPNQSHYTFKL